MSWLTRLRERRETTDRQLNDLDRRTQTIVAQLDQIVPIIIALGLALLETTPVDQPSRKPQVSSRGDPHFGHL